MGEWAEQPKAEGRAEGAIEARKESILCVLDKRGMSVSNEVRELIEGCHDPDQLFVWFDRAVDTWIDERFGG